MVPAECEAAPVTAIRSKDPYAAITAMSPQRLWGTMARIARPTATPKAVPPMRKSPLLNDSPSVARLVTAMAIAPF